MLDEESLQEWWVLTLLLEHNQSGFRKLGDHLTYQSASALMGPDDIFLARGDLVEQVTRMLAREEAPALVYLFEVEGVDQGDHCEITGRWQLTAIGHVSMSEPELAQARAKGEVFQQTAIANVYDGNTARRIFKKITTQ